MATLQNRFNELQREIRRGNLIGVITGFSDVLLVVTVVCMVGMMLIPLPTWLLDILLTINITLAVTILMVSLYIANPTQIASFPTILLITTLYRLALNISSTRLILGQAYAGEVIQSFGAFVAAGNIVVGAVIFLILTLIQFIVITKGSERVAEVSARFTLDAMPGKQMSIDADLRSGIIDVPEARRRRDNLQRESQFYGAMDGAMKFVKGDAIAGICITLINVAGGLLIGVLQRGMPAAEAAQVYSILTIGDGLVSQVPALLISVSAGMVVTRVASEAADGNLGKDVAGQILAHPKAIVFVAILLFVLAIVPGLPFLPFLILSIVMGGLGYGLFTSQESAAVETREATPIHDFLEDPEISVPLPVSLEVSRSLARFVDRDQEAGRTFFERLVEMRNDLYYDLGVVFPAIHVNGNSPLSGSSYRISLNEVPVRTGEIPEGSSLVVGEAKDLASLGINGTETTHPVTGRKALWIDSVDAGKARQGGLLVYDTAEVLVLIMAGFLRSNGREFIGIQEAQWMLDQVAGFYPKLVEEVVPKVIGLPQLVEILQRLVEEQISIRDMRAILECLSEWGPVEKDSVALADQARIALRRRISFQLNEGNPTLYVYQLDPEIEEMIRNAVSHTGTGSYLRMDPDQIQEVLTALQAQIGHLPTTAQRPVILTESDVRRYFRKLIESEYPDVSVLSYQELSPDVIVQPLAYISTGAGAEAQISETSSEEAL